MTLQDENNNQAGLLQPSQPSQPAQPSEPAHIHRMMTAIIQMQDYEKATRALNEAGIVLTRFSSSGGFLGRRNVTLLIGLSENQEALAVDILSKACRRRVEYISTPLEGAPFNMPLSTPVTVGGATIFTFPVERYEEIR